MLQVCLIHSQGSVSMIPYGARQAAITYQAPVLLPHTISMCTASGQPRTGDQGSQLDRGVAAFISNGSTINVQPLQHTQGPAPMGHLHTTDIDFVVRSSPVCLSA